MEHSNYKSISIYIFLPMNKTQIVNVIDGNCSLSHVKLSSFLSQNVFLHQKGHHVTSWQKLHHQVKVGRVPKLELLARFFGLES